MPPVDTTEQILAVNRAFYEAFEQRDLDAMSELWEHSDRIVCTHPGWATLRGWGAVSGSFFALFTQTRQQLQFILTQEQLVVAGDVAWVSVDENLLGDQGGNTVAALNLFARDSISGAWRMVAHHGSVVQAPSVAE